MDGDHGFRNAVNAGRSVQKILGVSPHVQFVSIPVDPRRDTTAKLARYRSRFPVEDGWRFLTGLLATIDSLVKLMEIRAERMPARDPVAEKLFGSTFSHTCQIHLVDGQDRVRPEYEISMLLPNTAVKDIQTLTSSSEERGGGCLPRSVTSAANPIPATLHDVHSHPPYSSHGGSARRLSVRLSATGPGNDGGGH